MSVSIRRVLCDVVQKYEAVQDASPATSPLLECTGACEAIRSSSQMLDLAVLGVSGSANLELFVGELDTALHFVQPSPGALALYLSVGSDSEKLISLYGRPYSQGRSHPSSDEEETHPEGRRQGYLITTQHLR